METLNEMKCGVTVCYPDAQPTLHFTPDHRVTFMLFIPEPFSSPRGEYSPISGSPRAHRTRSHNPLWYHFVVFGITFAITSIVYL